MRREQAFNMTHTSPSYQGNWAALRGLLFASFFQEPVLQLLASGTETSAMLRAYGHSSDNKSQVHDVITWPSNPPHGQQEGALPGSF